MFEEAVEVTPFLRECLPEKAFVIVCGG